MDLSERHFVYFIVYKKQLIERSSGPMWHSFYLCEALCSLLCFGVSESMWYFCMVEAFPVVEGVCGLSGPVSDPTDQQAEGVEVGAAQGRNRTSLWREPKPPADVVRFDPDRKISTTVGWIDVKYCSGFHGLQWMNPTDLGDALSAVV